MIGLIALGTVSTGAILAFPSAPTTTTVKVRIAPTRKIEVVETRPRKETTKSIGARDMACIASAIWHEAGNQSREGRIAIAEVVIARTRSGIYPKRACAVVAQRRQFSFVEHGLVPSVPSEQKAEMMSIARGVVEGSMRSRVRGALWFHATYVNPGWEAPVIGRIGSHIFYGVKS